MATGDRLPPLNAVRYFEAAARHLSFTKAAGELNVTHGAISHQVKALEEWLGVPLFRRLNRALVLTEAGQAYRVPVREALERLADGTRAVRERIGSGARTVSTLPSFAAKWLVPRLGNFRAAWPDIDVRISATQKLVDFARDDDVDCAIRHGHGPTWPGCESDLLIAEDFGPVCSPKLLEGPIPLAEPADLSQHTLLQDYDWRVDLWDRWLALAGVTGLVGRRALSFNSSNLMIQAAIDGLGVALSQSVLCGDDLAAGRLIRPFRLSVASDAGYHIVVPRNAAALPKVVAFRSWLLDEAAAYKAQQAKLEAETDS
jgi:LysR family glycine cleavage system transcriptional activator